MTNKEVTDLASRLQSLEFSYKQLEKITFEVKTSANEWKNKYTDVKQTADGLRSMYSRTCKEIALRVNQTRATNNPKLFLSLL